MSASDEAGASNVPHGSSLESQAKEARRQTSRGSFPGSPTGPIVASNSLGAEHPVAVGLNWQFVADGLKMDDRVLRHDGLILVAGEYFPAPGYFFEPATLRSQRVDVGDIALIDGYFIGQATLRQFNLALEQGDGPRPGYRHVIPSPQTGQIIGLFLDHEEAERTKARILRGSLGAGITVERGALGTEIRVARPGQPGRVASVIAAHGGGVIAINGRPFTSRAGDVGAIATGDGRPNQPGDARRAGIGVTGSSAGPEISSAIEAGRGHLEEYTRSN